MYCKQTYFFQFSHYIMYVPIIGIPNILCPVGHFGFIPPKHKIEEITPPPPTPWFNTEYWYRLKGKI